MSEKFYPEIKTNETYAAIDYIKANDYVPNFLKQEFIKVVKLISQELHEEEFNEREIEDYLKTLVEETVV